MKRSDYSRADKETGELVHDKHGYEIPDPTPLAPPVGYTRQPSLAERLREQRRVLQWEKSGLLDPNEVIDESLEDAEDFEVGDDYEPPTDNPRYRVPEDYPELQARPSSSSEPPPPAPSGSEPPPSAPQPAPVPPPAAAGTLPAGNTKTPQ